MDSVIRVVVMYIFLLAAFRLAGKRTLSDTTTFDMLLLLIVSETTQQAMVGDDHSMTNAFLLVLTFLAMSVGMSLLKVRSSGADRVLDGVPLVILENGKPIRDRMLKARVDEDDILEAAREYQGINSLREIRLAVLERNGKISVIANEGHA